MIDAIRIKTAVPATPAITAALGQACLGSGAAGTDNMAIQVSAQGVNKQSAKYT